MPAAIFAAALALRAAYLLTIRGAYFFDHLTTEPLRYQGWAQALLDGRAPLAPPFDEAPGYVALVAAVFAAAGRNVAAVALVQAVLDAASCALIALLARRIGGARAGWIAGALAACSGPLIYFTGELVPATATIFVLACALLATPAGAQAPRRRWIAAGCVWAAAILMRSEVLVALPLIALFAGRRASGWVVLPTGILLALSLSLNLASSGHLVPLSAGAGVNFWLGNNPLADGVSPFLHGPLAVTAREVSSQARDAVEADRAFTALAWSALREHPGALARLALRKLAWAFTDRELPNTCDIEWEKSHSPLFHRFFPLGLGFILPLAAVGLLRVRERRQLSLLLAPAAVALTTSVLFFTNARFRLPLALSALPLAGIALAELAQAVRSLRLWFAALAGLILAFANFDGVNGYRIPQLDTNTGILERGAGRPESAIFFLKRAQEGDDSDPVTWAQLAEAEEEAHQLREAADTWRRAALRLPGDLALRQSGMRFRHRTGLR